MLDLNTGIDPDENKSYTPTGTATMADITAWLLDVIEIKGCLTLEQLHTQAQDDFESAVIGSNLEAALWQLINFIENRWADEVSRNEIMQ